MSHTHPPRREGGTPVTLPALPGGEGVFIMVNPASGTSTIQADPMGPITGRLPRARVHQLTAGEDLAETLRAALVAEPWPRVLGVCGGDGSVAAVAQVARLAGLPLLVLPGGTFNHFARTAGIDSVNRAIDALLAGEGVRVDVAELRAGEAAPITVINAASVGIHPDFVAEREKRERRLGKWVAALIAAVRVLRASDPVSVLINGRPARVWSLFVGVNSNYPTTVAPLQRRRLDDGLLDVRILRAGSRVRATWSLVFGRRTSAALRRVLPRSTATGRFRTDALTVVVRPRRGQPPGFAHDGEVWPDVSGGRPPAGGYSFRFTMVPGGLEVYSPFVR